MPELPSPIQHSLPSASLPRSCFSLHNERFGYVLINRSQIIKVKHDAKPLIDTLMTGDTPLSRIADLFGQKALNFIGLLYDRRMIELLPTEPVQP
jgi:hypothetical protein